MNPTNLVIALAPAFAAGFAVQRLLEILDPLLIRLVGDERKKIFLGLLSLTLGLGLTGSLDLHVLGHLGVPLPGGLVYLDYLVTGLFISAGTEGLNSILKFLSYKKEETKAEAITKKLGATRSLARVGTGIGRSLSGNSLNNLTEGIMSTEEALENSLQQVILNNWSDKFVASTWMKRPFSKYTNDVDDAKVAVLSATRLVAHNLGIQLQSSVERNLQDQIGLDTTPEDALPLMGEALDWPAEPA